MVYEFDPGSTTDGVVIEVPLTALNQIHPSAFEWSVPGVRPDLVAALVRSLPKPLRRALVPVPDTVSHVLDRLDPAGGAGLLDALARELSHAGGATITADDFDLDKVPDHLRPTIRVVDADGRPIAQGKSVAALGDLLDRQVRTAISESGSSLERTGLTEWPGGDLPRVVDTAGAGHTVRAYPALVDEGDTVAVRLLPTADEQWEAMWAGTRTLLRRSAPAAVRAVSRMLTNRSRLALAVSPWRSEQEWAADVVAAAVDAVIDEAGGPSWTEDGVRALRAATASALPKLLADAAPVAVDILLLVGRLRPRIEDMTQPALAPSVADVRRQVDQLVYPGMLSAVGISRLADVRRYLQAIEHRLDKLPDAVAKDQERTVACRRLERELDAVADRVAPSPALEEATWLLQELRVATFAQHLGTARPVSDKRVRTAIAAAAAG